MNLAHRFNSALQGYSQTQFFYGQLENVFYDPSVTPFINRDLAIATRTIRGVTAFGIYPLNRYRRVEIFGGALQYKEEFNDPLLEEYSQAYQQQAYGTQLLQSGWEGPLGGNIMPETSV